MDTSHVKSGERLKRAPVRRAAAAIGAFMLVGCEPAADAYTTDPEYRYSADYAHGCLSGTDYDTGLVSVVFQADLTYSVKTGIITIDPSDDSRKPDLYFTGLADGSRPLQPVDAVTRQVLLENSCPGLS